MILSEFIRVMDIGWKDFFIWLLYFSLALGGYTALVMGYTRIAARQVFIKNELPKVHNKELQKERDKNNKLKKENKSLINESEILLIEKEKLQARFILIKNHFEEGMKDEQETMEADTGKD